MPRIAPHLQALLLALLWLSCAWGDARWGARAQEVRVAVVEPAGGDPMADRLISELVAVGLKPVSVVRPPTVDGEDSPPLTPLDRIRADADARAAFEVDTPRATLWMVVAHPELGAVEREMHWNPRDPSAEALVGVQAVEMLRAEILAAAAVSERKASRLSLLELMQIGQGPAGSRIGLTVGTEVSVGSLEGSPQGRMALGLRVPLPVERLRATLDLQLAGKRTTFAKDPRSTLYLGQTEAQLGLGVLLADPSAGWLPDAGLALGLAWRTVTVDPQPLWRVLGQPERSVVRPLVGVRTGITTPRVGPVGVRGELQLDLGRSQQVQVEGEPVGRWGPAALGFGLAADVVF